MDDLFAIIYYLYVSINMDAVSQFFYVIDVVSL